MLLSAREVHNPALLLMFWAARGVKATPGAVLRHRSQTAVSWSPDWYSGFLDLALFAQTSNPGIFSFSCEIIHFVGPAGHSCPKRVAEIKLPVEICSRSVTAAHPNKSSLVVGQRLLHGKTIKQPADDAEDWPCWSLNEYSFLWCLVSAQLQGQIVTYTCPVYLY